MNDDKVISNGNSSGWKLWAAAVAGAILAYIISDISGIGADKIFIEEGQKFGFALGSGLVVGLLMWLVFYFPVFRHVPVSRRILAYVIILLGGTFGVLGNL